MSLENAKKLNEQGLTSLCRKPASVTFTDGCKGCSECNAAIQKYHDLLDNPIFQGKCNATSMFIKVCLDTLNDGDTRVFFHPLTALLLVLDTRKMSDAQMWKKVRAAFGKIVPFDQDGTILAAMATDCEKYKKALAPFTSCAIGRRLLGIIYAYCGTCKDDGALLAMMLISMLLFDPPGLLP